MCKVICRIARKWRAKLSKRSKHLDAVLFSCINENVEILRSARLAVYRVCVTTHDQISNLMLIQQKK